MAIIRKGVEKVGSFSLKKMFSCDVSSGTEECIAMITIPQWCHLGYGTVRFEVTGKNEKEAYNTTEFAIRGSIAEIDEATVLDTNNWQTQMEKLVPIDPDQIESDTNDAIDVGITGREQPIPASAGHEFFRREYTLGLHRNTAYPTNSEAKVTYKTQGSYKGHFKTDKMMNITKPKQLFIGALTNIPHLETSNQHNVSSGGYHSPEQIYNDLMAKVPFPVGPLGVPGTTTDVLDTQMERYLYYGYGTDTTVSDDDLMVNVWISARLDIYTPAQANYVAAP